MKKFINVQRHLLFFFIFHYWVGGEVCQGILAWVLGNLNFRCPLLHGKSWKVEESFYYPVYCSLQKHPGIFTTTEVALLNFCFFFYTKGAGPRQVGKRIYTSGKRAHTFRKE